jgi:hypothetical protein
MKTTAIVALLVSGLLAAACGSQEPAVEQPTPAAEETTPPAEAVQPEATPTAEATPPAETAPVVAPPAEVEPAAPAALSVAVEGLTKGQSGPSKAKLQVTAAAETNAIVVSLANYSHYCSPAPSFNATAKAESLEITAVKPTGSISRCFAPHAMKLRVELPGRNNIRTVVLLGADGKQLASAVIGAK